MKKLLLVSATLGFTVIAATPACAEELGVSISIDYATEYVFRGTSLGTDVFQPGIEVAVGDFYAGVWGSTGIGDSSDSTADEIDYYAGYGFALPGPVSGDIGATIYHYPETGSAFDFGDSSTFEVYGGLSFDTVLAPSVYAYYDFNLENFTAEGTIGHSIPVGERTSLDLGLNAGLSTGDSGDWEWATASVAFGHSFTDVVSAYVGGNYSVNSDNLLDYEDVTLDDGETNQLFFGVGVAAGF